MLYDFSKRKSDIEQLVFPLTLDRKKLTERIVIGQPSNVRRRLENGDGEVYYDKTKPLGTFLINFEADPTGQWDSNANILRESYGHISLGEKRWKQTAAVRDFLNEKCQTGGASSTFAAIKTWDEYLKCFYLDHSSEVLINRLSILNRPFLNYSEKKPWQEKASDAFAKVMRAEDSSVELWYPVAKRPLECVVITASLQPLIAYYMNKIEEWGYVFQECKMCGSYFLARSRHYELCSDECRKKQSAIAQKEYDERIQGDKMEDHDSASYYYWYNRLRKLEKGKAAAPEKAMVVKEAFKVFRKEAVKRKKQVKDGKMPEHEFIEWLFQQQNVVDKLMER